MIYDFHIHSNHSDGLKNISELIHLAHEKNIKYMCITDHDTTNGVKEAIKLASNFNINIKPALELSTIYNNENIHVLVYFNDNSCESPDFQDFLSEIRNFRVERTKKIIKLLNTHFNVVINENLLNYNKTIARPDIAYAIINSGYNYDYEYIFKTILSKDSPAYVPSTHVDFIFAIKKLKNFNSINILAHPVLIKNTPIDFFIEYIDGIEVFYPLHDENFRKHLIDICIKHNKLMTVGSDFHGYKNDSKHGILGETTFEEDYIHNFVNKLFK